jgi:hypothetical protein
MTSTKPKTPPILKKPQITILAWLEAGKQIVTDLKNPPRFEGSTQRLAQTTLNRLQKLGYIRKVLQKDNDSYYWRYRSTIDGVAALREAEEQEYDKAH